VLAEFRLAVQHMRAVSLTPVADALGRAGNLRPGGARS
jgi:hypothetical protein